MLCEERESMNRAVAIAGDPKQACWLMAKLRNGQVVVEDASTVPIALDAGEDAALRMIREGLAASNVHKCDALVAVGRSLAEVRRVQLPVMPEVELPDVIRFQAPRQFTNVAEDWPIDFVPIRVDADGVEVMAAAIAPQTLQRIVRFATDAQLELQTVGLRPLAAAALYVHSVPQGDRGLVLLVDRFVEDADIVLLRDGIPIFVRSIRLPEGEELARKQLIGELRRSWIACAESLGDKLGTGKSTTPRVVIWGLQRTHAEELEAIRQGLDVEAIAIDPFDLVEINPQLRSSLGDHVGRFAPLLGMLRAHAEGKSAWIDFLHPRRAPEPQSQRGRMLVYGSLAAVGAAAMAGLIWRQFGALDQQIAGRVTESKALDPFVTKAAESVADLNRLKAFDQTDIDWLGELARTSERLPPAQEVRIEKFSASMRSDGGGRLDIAGRAIGPSVVTGLEQRLRDENHSVRGEGAQADPRQPAYGWTFTNSIQIKNGTADYVVPDQPPPQAAADAAAPEAPGATETAPSSAKDGKGSTEDIAKGSVEAAEATAPTVSPAAATASDAAAAPENVTAPEKAADPEGETVPNGSTTTSDPPAAESPAAETPTDAARPATSAAGEEGSR
jgi:hypothetical protein